MIQVTSEKQDALRLNEAMLQEHEELQHFMAQEVSRHHNAEVRPSHSLPSCIWKCVPLVECEEL